MPTFHLVVYEAMPVGKLECRVRVWRRAGQPPLVLSSQIPGQQPPGCCNSFVANFVLRNFPGFSLRDPVLFLCSASTCDSPARAGSTLGFY